MRYTPWHRLHLLGCLLLAGLAACQTAVPVPVKPITVPAETRTPTHLPPTAPPTHTSTSPATPSATPGLLPAASITDQPARQPFFTQEYAAWELVLSLAWSPDGRSLAVSAGGTIYLVDTAGFSTTHTLPTGIWSPALAWNPQGSLLASGGRDGVIQVWNPISGELLIGFPAHKKGTNALAFDPTGSVLASGGNDAVSRLWDPSNGENLAQMIGGTYAVPAIAFTPDGLSLALVNGTVIRLRDVASGRFVQTLRSGETVFSAAFSPQGDLLAGGDTSGSVTIWQVADAAVLQQFKATPFRGAASLVWDVAFSPDGRRLAAVTGAGNLVLWNVETGTVELDLKVHRLAATSLAWSPDGRWLATGGLEAAVHIWQIPLGP